MRKYFKVAVALLVLAGVFLVGTKAFNNSTVSSDTKALGKVFKTVDELSDSSQLILKAKIKSSIGQEKQGRFNNALYPIEIIEIIKNTSDNTLAEKDIINLSKSIELEGKETIAEGEYFLFLNTYAVDGKTYYCNNSVYNLYKLEKDKYINVQSDNFKANRLGFSKLDSLDQKDITNLKNKYIK